VRPPRRKSNGQKHAGSQSVTIKRRKHAQTLEVVACALLGSRAMRRLRQWTGAGSLLRQEPVPTAPVPVFRVPTRLLIALRALVSSFSLKPPMTPWSEHSRGWEPPDTHRRTPDVHQDELLSGSELLDPSADLSPPLAAAKMSASDRSTHQGRRATVCASPRAASDCRGFDAVADRGSPERPSEFFD